MSEPSARSLHLQGLLERLAAGEPAALDELILRVCERLRKLTRQMLRGYPGVKRWAETDDVMQSALMRLLRALKEVRPTSSQDFFALATLQIRRELIDLARHYFGPQGPGAKHATDTNKEGAPHADRPDSTHEPSRLAEWCEFHAQVDQLPTEEREVVGLLYYQGMNQAEAAELLRVSVRTVQRRWQAALLKLHKILKPAGPGS